MAVNENESTLTGSQKLVNLANLARYNHNLCDKLGLTNDTFGYSYATVAGAKDTADNDISILTADGALNPSFTKAADVKHALDQLYDLVAQGSGIKSVATGKSDKAEATTVSFEKSGTDTDKELYYVHFVNADGSETNLELDAEDFVKDGVIHNARVVYSDATSLSQENGGDATALPTGASANRSKGEGEGNYKNSFIELVVKNATDPDAADEFSFMFINTADLLGDLVGGAGITIDGGKISADVATQTDGKLVKLVLTGDSVTDASQLDVTIAGAQDSTSYTKTATGATTTDLTIAAVTSNGVIDNNELKNALDDVKSYIDDRDAANSVDVIDGANINSDTALSPAQKVTDGIYVSSAADATTGKTTFTVGAVVATDTEIDALFTAHS